MRFDDIRSHIDEFNEILYLETFVKGFKKEIGYGKSINKPKIAISYTPISCSPVELIPIDIECADEIVSVIEKYINKLKDDFNNKIKEE